MGVGCAPSYANLYLGVWEHNLLSQEKINVDLNNVMTRHRYINDVLMVWAGSKDELKQYLENLQHNSYNLKFTYNYSQERITFLDIEIYVNEVGNLCSTIYRKPTAGNTLLHATGSHPKPLVNSIPYSQYHRLKRNCTQEEDLRERHINYINIYW